MMRTLLRSAALFSFALTLFVQSMSMAKAAEPIKVAKTRAEAEQALARIRS